MSFHPSLIVSHPHFNFSSSRTFSISFSTNLHMLLAVHLYDPKIYPCRAFYKYSFTKDTNNKDFPFRLLPFSHPVRNITSSYKIPFKQTYCFCISPHTSLAKGHPHITCSIVSSLWHVLLGQFLLSHNLCACIIDLTGIFLCSSSQLKSLQPLLSPFSWARIHTSSCTHEFWVCIFCTMALYNFFVIQHEVFVLIFLMLLPPFNHPWKIVWSAFRPWHPIIPLDQLSHGAR